MPELPEVEVVRSGLERWIVPATVKSVDVFHPRPVRHHPLGADGFSQDLDGAQILAVARRGKFCWLELDQDRALVAHLGMSGQLLLEPPAAPAEKHLRVRIGLAGTSALEGRELRFVDQRMFGGLRIDELVPTADGLAAGLGTTRAAIPLSAAHIARDLLDSAIDLPALITKLRRRNSGIKRALLDQNLVSGVGNIYADEALHQVNVHGEIPCSALSEAQVDELLRAAKAVMEKALAQGGTSFDSLYVDVNGSSGYFSRSLQVYGREGQACYRCGEQIIREKFMNRSSFSCPQCQPPAQ